MGEGDEGLEELVICYLLPSKGIEHGELPYPQRQTTSACLAKALHNLRSRCWAFRVLSWDVPEAQAEAVFCL